MQRWSSVGFSRAEFISFGLALSGLLALFVPNTLRAHARTYDNVCVENLKAIASAKRHFLESNHLPPDTTLSLWQLVGPKHAFAQLPRCPAGGVYSLEHGDRPPTCSLGETHQLTP